MKYRCERCGFEEDVYKMLLFSIIVQSRREGRQDSTYNICTKCEKEALSELDGALTAANWNKD